MAASSGPRGRMKVLYLHHSGGLDGSLVSLCELLRFLDRDRFEPVVALLRPSEPARRAIEAAGSRAVDAGGIAAFHHATAFWSDPRRPWTWPPLVGTAMGWRSAVAATRRLVEAQRPDVVHVNSVVLAPSADALRRSGTPFVWHVREAPVPGRGRLRTRFLRRALATWPTEALFLSEASRQAWMGSATGVVVPELVDPLRFDPARDGLEARRAAGIPDGAAVVLFLGGTSELKGVVPLLRALPRVAERVPGVVCVMPGAAPGPAAPPASLAERIARAAGLRTAARRVERAFALEGAGRCCMRLAFTSDVPGWLAAADLLVFPALDDHFPRPVVEAGFMGRPFVASRLPIVAEAAGSDGGGLLVPPGDPVALADAIAALLRDPARRAAMGSAGRAAALRKFDAATNTRAIEEVYARTVARGLRA